MALVRSVPLVSKPAARGRGTRGARFAAAFAMYWLLVITPFLAACEPTAKLPLTGEVSLQFVRESQSGFHFRLANQSAQVISLRGTYNKGVGDPWDTDADCKAPNSDTWMEGPFALVDAGAHSIEVSPGEQLELIVNSKFAEQHKGGRCRLNLRLQGGRFITSGEFEP